MGETAAISSAVSGLTSISGSVLQGEALKSQGKYQQEQANFNATLSEMDAADAIRMGNKAATKFKKQGKQFVGSQRAAYAAQGIDVSQGSAKEVVSDTRRSVDEDAREIVNNAWRQAWGFKVQASNYLAQGALARAGAKAAAGQTLLTGGLQALDSAGKSLYYSSVYGSNSKSGAASSSASESPYDYNSWSHYYRMWHSGE